MPWNVLFHDDFHAEFQAMGGTLQDELLAHARLLQEFGPHMGRPTVDTLKGSRHANTKEFVLIVKVGHGGWLLHLIQNAQQSCWWAATRVAQISGDSIKS